MLRKILFPTDFSEHCVKVNKELKKLAGLSKELILLNVLDSRLFSYVESIDSVEIKKLNIMGDLVDMAEKNLARWPFPARTSDASARTSPSEFRISNERPFMPGLSPLMISLPSWHGDPKLVGI